MSRGGLANQKARQRQAAFTLLEVLVAVAVSVVVVGAIVAFQRYQLATLRQQAAQVDLQGTARSVVDLVARETRRTGKNPTCNPAVGGLITAKRRELRLQTDLDGDGLLTRPNEDVTYKWDPSLGAVLRVDNAGNASDTLIEDADLTGSGFYYFDGNGNELDPGLTGLDPAQRKNVRRIRFDLAVADVRANAGASPARVRASTNIDLRNRFFVADNSRCTPTVAQPTFPTRSQTPTFTSTPAGQPTGAPTRTPAPTNTPQCKQAGAPCSSKSECCTGNCTGNPKTCSG